jgi:hypothetical protein
MVVGRMLRKSFAPLGKSRAPSRPLVLQRRSSWNIKSSSLAPLNNAAGE